MYELLGTSLALAALLIANWLLSLAAALLWRAIQAHAMQWSAERRARGVFVLRVCPTLAATAFVFLFFIPSYLLYEPRATNEAISLRLAAFALFSALGILLAFWRGFVAWLATNKLIKDWQRHSTPIENFDAIKTFDAPARLIEHRFPVVAVVGIFRPQLFIARSVIERLSADELRAVVAHEAGHLRARDNLKRAVLRLCRDTLVIFPTGRALEQQWSDAAEIAADDFAVARTGASLELAQALIKVARLAPEGATPLLPAGAFLVGERETLSRRVERLIQTTDARTPLVETNAREFNSTMRLIIAALAALSLYFVFNMQTLAVTHAAVERIVAMLQ